MNKSLLTFLFHNHRRWLRWTRAVTLGTRTIVIKDGSVLLIRMTYAKGWYLPGGGVDRGESFEASALRELAEECGLQGQRPELVGVYLNKKGHHSDHIAVYAISDFSGEARVQDPLEIEEVRFFDLNALPADLWPGQRRRIDEFLGLRPKSGIW